MPARTVLRGSSRSGAAVASASADRRCTLAALPTNRKDVQEVLDAIEEDGWRVESSADGYKLYAPSGSGYRAYSQDAERAQLATEGREPNPPLRSDFQVESTLMEFDVLAVLSALDGEDPEVAAEQLLHAFARSHAETGSVASADLTRGTFDIAFTVEAADVYEAIDVAKDLFAAGASAAMLASRPLDGFHIDAATADREAIPA